MVCNIFQKIFLDLKIVYFAFLHVPSNVEYYWNCIFIVYFKITPGNRTFLCDFAKKSCISTISFFIPILHKIQFFLIGTLSSMTSSLIQVPVQGSSTPMYHGSPPDRELRSKCREYLINKTHLVFIWLSIRNNWLYQITM